MEKKSKLKKAILIIVFVLVAVLAVLFAAFRIYTGNFYEADDVAIQEIAEYTAENVTAYTDETGTVFIPNDQNAKAVVIFYPGGKVEYSAYSSLMYELSDKGYICVIPKMKANLAFLSIDVIDDIRRTYADEMAYVADLDWYLAGHSLGGVAASKYLSDNAAHEEGSLVAGFKGLILCASYPTDSLADTSLRFLSILGSNDGVINMANYEQARANWPKDSTERIIEGGIHSYFGSYGIQEGDGEPQISNQQQLDITAEIIDEWISQ